MKVTQYLKKNGEKRSSDRVIFHVYGGRHLGFGSCVTGVNKHHRAFVNTFLRTVYGSGTAVGNWHDCTDLPFIISMKYHTNEKQIDNLDLTNDNHKF